MAEAVCGPSNAIQNFQKHASVDRTLQQDRTVAGRRAEQGFRSVTATAGALDAEFHAFQAPQIPSVPLQRAQLPLAHVTRYATPPLQVLPDWASDFQKLNVSESRLPSTATHQTYSTQVAQGAWHTEFQRQSSPHLQMPISQPALGHWQPQYQGLEPYGGDIVYAPNTQHLLPEQAANRDLQFDDTAFARAFDQATEDMHKITEEKGKQKTAEEFSMDHACTDPGDVLGGFDFDEFKSAEDTIRPLNTYPGHEQEEVIDPVLYNQEQSLPRIGADTIAARSESEAINPQVEADELSRTAGHLLDTLKDEKNAKFQQSSFLALMRQLRDKEVKVDGDKMVPMNQPSTNNSHPGGRYYPYDAFTRAPLNSKPDVSSDGPPIQHYYADP